MRYLISSTALAIVLGASPLQATELTVITAGDQNMVDYVNNYLAPIFEKQNPGDTVRAVGTGPGDAGSQKIIERLEEHGAAHQQHQDDQSPDHRGWAMASDSASPGSRGRLPRLRMKAEASRLATISKSSTASSVAVRTKRGWRSG